MITTALLLLTMTPASMAVMAAVAKENPHAANAPFSFPYINEDMFVPDIGGYDVVFQSCKSLEAANYDKNKNTVPTREQYVIYRLCPPGLSCSEDFGEYVVDIEDYLSEIISYQKNVQMEECQNYEETSYPSCYNYAKERVKPGWIEDCEKNLERCSIIDSVDATQFSYCQMMYDPPDTSNDSGPLYVGPLCSGENGSEVTIGVFTDPHCTILHTTEKVEDYLQNEDGYGLYLLSKLWDSWQATYGNHNNILHCMGSHNQIHESCKSLYWKSSRCETPHGFKPVTEDDKSHHFYHLHSAEEERLEEAWACDFIDKLTLETTNNDYQWSELFVNAFVASLALAGVATMVVVFRNQKQSKQKHSSNLGVEWGGGRENYELIPMDGTVANTR